MSVSNEINRISNNVKNALNAVEEQGVAVPASANSDNLAELISRIGNDCSISVSKTGSVSTLTVTDKNGTQSVQIEDGEDGDDGTSVTVKSVSESTTDGGSNVVTFSDGKTVTIKNGSKGSTGADGAKGDKGEQGATGVGIKSVTQTTTSSADGGSNVITVTKTDNTTSTFTVKNGSKGSKGDKGDKGDDGEKGLPGENGLPGSDGYTPIKGKDYWTAEDKEEINADSRNFISTELAKRNQLKPEFASSTSECTDTTKLYVLPDGYIYAYMLTEVESGPSYTNRLPLAVASGGGEYVGDNGEDGYRNNYRYSASSNAEKYAEGYAITGFIRAKAGDIIRIKNVTELTTSNDGSGYCVAYFFTDAYAKTTGSIDLRTAATYENGIYSFTIPSYDTISFFRVTLKGVTADTIITVNEEITEGGGGTTTDYAWVSTGHAFVPADYEDRIVELEEETAQHTTDIENLKKGITNTTPIKKWDSPIYDANIPVFELSTEKKAITETEKTVSAVYAKYDALMAKHPHYITKTNLGMCSDGVTPVYRYDFREPEPHRGVSGAKEWSETKTKAIIVSGIHWEWGGIFALYNALEELADNPELLNLRRNSHLIVLPICNPYAVANMSVRNANQVEIHRNFEVDFIYPGELGYIELGERSHGGTEPLSEIETQYIDNIMKENKDAAFFLTCHSCQGDEVYGTSFIWSSPATYYMCNMAYRVIDKLSNAWISKYGDELSDGIADYKTANLPDWDKRLGMAYLSTTNGTEQKQATKYGIQGTNVEITDAFLTHGTKANPEQALSSFTMSRGAEVYVNFLLTALGTYDHKDKALYS